MKKRNSKKTPTKKSKSINLNKIKNMNIDEMKLGDLKKIAAMFNHTNSDNVDSAHCHPFKIGKSYFIRTVTMNIVGKLIAVHDKELLLTEASWIADSGRLNNALKQGFESQNSAEIEPFPNDVIVGRGSIIDATEFSHTLPTQQK